MAKPNEDASREGARSSLLRIQEFDVTKLPREAELGKSYSFSDATEPANRIIELFKRLSPAAIDDFGKPQQDQVKGQADACFNLFNSVLEFDAKQANAHDQKQSLILTAKEIFVLIYQFVTAHNQHYVKLRQSSDFIDSGYLPVRSYRFSLL